MKKAKYRLDIDLWQEETKDLQPAEQGALFTLAGHYLSTKKPLPLSRDRLYRIAGAIDEDERNAVMYVIESRFKKTDAGYLPLIKAFAPESKGASK